MRPILTALAIIAALLLAPTPSEATGGNRQCDFNGDGFDDVAIGVPAESVGSIAGAGAVNVIYGSALGLTAVGDQLWTQNSPGVAGSAEDGDSFGSKTECGDFNDDGYADLVAASPSEKIATHYQAGAIHLIFGSPAGLMSDGSLYLHRDTPGVAGQAMTRDGFGTSLATGDLNGDGHDDIAVGTYLHDIAGVEDAGSVQVFYGAAAGVDLATDKIWHRGTAGIKGNLEESAAFGFSLTIGDFNGDGYDDLAAGSPNDRVTRLSVAGSVSVIYGSESGLVRRGDALLHRDTAGISGSAEAGAAFGSSLAAGDFDGDGDDDLAVGAPGDTVSGSWQAGSVHIIEGSDDGLTTVGDRIWHRDKPGVRGVAEGGDWFGRALATGQFDDGPQVDLAIGVSRDRPNGVREAGSVHVLYGTVTGLMPGQDEIWHQDRKGIKGVNDEADLFGWSIGTGDLDGNGQHDLLIGVPLEDGPTTSNSGRIAVIYGSPVGLTTAGDQSWSQDSPGIKEVAESGESWSRIGGGTAG